MSLVLAVLGGATCAVLLVAGPTVHAQGATEHCPGVIASAESGEPDLPARRPAHAVDDRAHRVARACAARQHQWTLLAGVAAVVCLGAGSVARFRGATPEAAGSGASAPAR